MVIARQSTARTVMVGPVLDADGVAVTGGVVADFKISKNGGAPAALNGSATLTHRHTGFYSLALTASDLDTVGQAEVTIDDTVNACPMKEITVIEEAVYDISFAASATGAVPVASIAANAITASAIATGAIDADAIADGAIDAGAIAADAITAAKIADGAIDAATFAAGAIDAAAIAADAITAAKIAPSAMVKGDQIAGFNDLSSAAVSTLVEQAIEDKVFDNTIPSGAKIDTIDGIVDDILADTADMQPKLGTPAGVSISADIAAIEAQTDDIGTAGAGLTALASAANLALVAAVTDKIDDTLEDDGGTFRFTTNALEQAPTGGSAPSAATIADAVWDEARAGHVVSGSFGEYVPADATRISGDAVAADNAEAFFDGTGYAGTNNVIPTVTSVTNQVTANVTAISGDTTAADNLESAADGTGFNLGGGSIVAASVTGAVGSVSGSVGGNVTGSVGSLATQAKADVNAELVDALTVDVLADSIAADGSRPTMGQAALSIYRFLMERSVSGTTLTVKKEDGSTTSMTFTLNDSTSPSSITRSA